MRSLPMISAHSSKGRVGGHHKAGALICAGDHLKEEFGAHLGEGHVAQLVQNQEMLAPLLTAQRLRARPRNGRAMIAGKAPRPLVPKEGRPPGSNRARTSMRENVDGQ